MARNFTWLNGAPRLVPSCPSEDVDGRAGGRCYSTTPCASVSGEGLASQTAATAFGGVQPRPVGGDDGGRRPNGRERRREGTVGVLRRTNCVVTFAVVVSDEPRTAEHVEDRLTSVPQSSCRRSGAARGCGNGPQPVWPRLRSHTGVVADHRSPLSRAPCQEVVPSATNAVDALALVRSAPACATNV